MPYSACIFSPSVSNYSNILGLKQHGYGEMPRFEQTLASYLSHEPASSLKAPGLPTNLHRTTLALVCKAFTAVGQASTCLHTRAVLLAYQADLLRDLDKVEEVCFAKGSSFWIPRLLLQASSVMQ